MNLISFESETPLTKIEDMLTASLIFEHLEKLVLQESYVDINNYLVQNWNDIHPIIMPLLELASRYHAHKLVEMVMNILLADMVIPYYRKQEIVDFVNKLEQAVERELGCQFTARAIPMFTPNEFTRLLQRHTISRYTLRKGANTLLRFSVGSKASAIL